jgi:DNA helicase-2/ATP-dependent DNA helicase PcrA
VDFDDLLVLWRQVLERDAEAREETQRRFAHVLVDEYQDTNLVQGRIADLVAGAHRNLMVVGDDAQSIYSFRGANFQNIIGFTDRYPDAKLYRLEINYRSTPEILSLANASIAHNRLQFAKTLEAQIAPGAKPKLVPLTRAEEQADYVAQRIRELEDEGLPLDEIAVLYRSHYLALDLQMELARRGIPFEVRSGLRFTEMAHVKDATAYLRVAVNPKDEIAWKRILQLLPRVGRATAGRIWAAVEASKDPIGDLLAGRLPAPRAVRDSVGKLADTVRAVRNQPDNPSAQLDAVLAWGYQEHVEDTWDNASSRLQDLRTLATWAGRFGSTAGFLSELALMSDAAETAGAADDGPPERKVVLSTVHQAKGLEWEAVFVIWLADGRFPDQRAVGEGGEEEERRLFYVATTRARRHLELCFPMFGREGQFAGVRLKVSRFLEELPAELVTAVAVRRGGWGQGRAREPHPDDDDRWMDGDE